MNQSESIIKIIPALLKCQGKIETVEKNADNPFFKSKYADLNSLISACKKILNDNEIVVLQPISGDVVKTVLYHTSGEWISSSTRIVSKTDTNPQDQGSAITYARRYGLQSMLFMSAEDDDGERATDHKNTSPEPLRQTIVKPTPNLSSESKVCPKCGSEMVFKSGVSKSGKSYKGYFCPNRDSDPIFIR